MESSNSQGLAGFNLRLALRVMGTWNDSSNLIGLKEQWQQLGGSNQTRDEMDLMVMIVIVKASVARSRIQTLLDLIVKLDQT